MDRKIIKKRFDEDSSDAGVYPCRYKRRNQGMDVIKMLKESLVLNENGDKAFIKIEGKDNITEVRCWLDAMDNSIRLIDLDLSLRAHNCLGRYFEDKNGNGDYTVEQLVDLVNSGEIDNVKYLGKVGKAEVIRKLTREGLL